MREKLMKLLCNAHGMATDASLFENASYAQQLEAEADFLIANCVTIPVRCKDCWKSAEGLCSYQFKNVPGKDFCGDGERENNDE